MCDCQQKIHPDSACGGDGCFCHFDPPELSVVEELTLEQELSAVLNRHSQENGSGTPDFILANYLIACLEAYNTAVMHRAEWRGDLLIEESAIPAPGIKE